MIDEKTQDNIQAQEEKHDDNDNFYFILSILGDINGLNQLLVSVLFYFSSFVSILGHINEPNQL